MINRKRYDILHGDSAFVLKNLPDECVDRATAQQTLDF